MADIKQLKIKIQSTKNIKKITNAMEIISTIKLQKIKKTAEHLRDYMNTFLISVSRIEDYVPLFQKSTAKTDRECVILLSSEKGLCGSLNSTLFKQFASDYADRKSQIDIYAVGKKAREYVVRNGYVLVGSCSLSDNFERESLQSLYDFVNISREHKQYRAITVWYNYFKNTMKQIPIGFQLFPMTRSSFRIFLETLEIPMPQRVKSPNTKPYIELEPDRKSLSRKIYEMMMEIVLYGSVLHNKTGEFASRMLAMKGAKDNATTIINDLTLAYNKARQDAITKEVLEIVSAKAVIEN